jgi:hypothetical protein
VRPPPPRSTRASPAVVFLGVVFTGVLALLRALSRELALDAER